MLLIRLLRFIKGYVYFTAKGGFPERFINLCKRYGIALTELRNSGDGLSAGTDCASYKRIRSVAKKSGMKVRMTSKHGLMFFVNSHSRRMGLVAGALTGIAILCILSTRIWIIDVTGNNAVQSERILAAFEQLGVKNGAAAERINISEVEKQASKLLPELSWLNINVDGCTALIEVREAETVSGSKDKTDEPSNIVASRDGTIVQLRPFSGTQEQKIGSAVLKGDLLISGINENKDLTVSFCRAEGYVVARTSHKLGFSQPREFAAAAKTTQKRGYVLEFLVFDIPFGKIPKNGFAEEKKLFINGVELPLGIIRITENIENERKIKLTEERAVLLARHEFFGNCSDEFKGLNVEKAEITQKGAAVSGVFTCLENIASEQPMQIDEDGGSNKQS